MSTKLNRYENCNASVKDEVLTLAIIIDEDKVDVQPSKSGKTLIVATTGGFQRIPGTGLSLNMTLFRKA